MNEIGFLIPPTSIDDQIAEVERELAKRLKVYPQLVARGKMTMNSARSQTMRLEAALETLRTVKATEPR